MKETLLNKPIIVQNFFDVPVKCKTFREYVTVSMQGDPDYFMLDPDAANEITRLINEGTLTLENALSYPMGKYYFDDDGHEYIKFPDVNHVHDMIHNQ